MADSQKKLVDVTLDHVSIRRGSIDVDHERRVAIHDLLETNHFDVIGHEGGPYRLTLMIIDRKLVFVIGEETEADPIVTHILSLSPLRKLVKDYHTLCESYYEAIRTSSPRQIEAIDMGRRAMHNEAALLLKERLSQKVRLDLETARRLFTLICVLHWRG